MKAPHVTRSFSQINALTQMCFGVSQDVFFFFFKSFYAAVGTVWKQQRLSDVLAADGPRYQMDILS